MKLFVIHIVFFLGGIIASSFTLQAQSAIPVASNDNVTTTIFFPSGIAKVVPPAANFKFEYEQGSNIGLLKGRNGKPSNLTVITEQGHIYSFALRFSEEVQKFNFILNTEQAIGQTKPITLVDSGNQSAKNTKSPDTVVRTNEAANNDQVTTVEKAGNDENKTSNSTGETKDTNQPIVPVKTTEATHTPTTQIENIPQEPRVTQNMQNGEDDLYNVDRTEYYRIFCENNYLQKTIFKRSFRQNKRIAVRLNNILVDRNEKYFVLQIENNSKKEFEVAGLSFFKKSDVGQLEKIMNPLYSFNLQENIDPDSINEVVYVFENFKITGKERIFIALADENSDHMVILPLDDLLINSPSN